MSTLQDEESEVGLDDMLSMFQSEVRGLLMRRLRGLRELGANMVQLEYVRDMFLGDYQDLPSPRPPMSEFVATFFGRRLDDMMRALAPV